MALRKSLPGLIGSVSQRLISVDLKKSNQPEPEH